MRSWLQMKFQVVWPAGIFLIRFRIICISPLQSVFTFNLPAISWILNAGYKEGKQISRRGSYWDKIHFCFIKIELHRWSSVYCVKPFASLIFSMASFTWGALVNCYSTSQTSKVCPVTFTVPLQCAAIVIEGRGPSLGSIWCDLPLALVLE